MSRATAPRPNLGWLGVAAALLLYWWMATGGSSHVGVTADEVVHLTGGYSYWTQNDYRLHPENGNLAQRIAALPLLGMDLRFPGYDSPGWATAQANTFGGVFFHDLGNPVDDMLWHARMAIAVVGAFGVWLTWRWARGLFGRKAGWVALTLAVFCPAMLAHGGLATSDMTLAVCMLAALGSFWRLLHRATWGRLALAALACGAVFLAKMSGVLVIPVIAALVVVRSLRPTPMILRLGRSARVSTKTGRLFAGAGLAAIVAAGSLVVVWAGFGFRYSGFNPDLPATSGGGYYFSWETMLGREALPRAEGRPVDRLAPGQTQTDRGIVETAIEFARDHRLLPEAYLWGFAQTRTFSKRRPAYLDGEYSFTGWRSFFPLAFLWKTTPAAILLVVVAAAAPAIRKRAGLRAWPKGRLYRSAPLLIFLVLYGTTAINMNLNIGHRHILPVYPILYVLASSVVLLPRPRRMAIAALLLPLALVAHAGESLLSRPHYLSYFNAFGGGPQGGYRRLVDSSFDWGQGLPDLARWIGQQRAAGDDSTIFLSYFGADSPRARKLDVRLFGDEIYDRGTRVFPARMSGGWYAVGATQLSRVYNPTRGPWTAEHEALYRELHARLRDPALRAPGAAEEALVVACDYELLQSARIFHMLEKREPLEVVGGAILIYRLSDEEIADALAITP